MIKIAPSILSADFAEMGNAVEHLTQWNADWVHFDVMDGSFVPNITFGPTMCAALHPHTDLPFDVHLMVERPADWILPFQKAGASSITFHTEADRHSNRTLQIIRETGMLGGVAINPGTPLEATYELLPYCDLVLLMSVNPGFGGQSFIPESVQKIARLSEYIRAHNLNVEIEVDGGVNLATAQLCIDAGATILVAGNAVFRSDDPKQTIRALRCER